MSFFRYIQILSLATIVIFQTSFASVVALSDEGIAVNSIESLSIPIEERDQDIANTTVQNAPKEIQPELKMNIQSLLDANREYATKNTITTEATTTDSISDASLSQAGIMTLLDGTDSIFDDFLTTADTRLLSEAK